MKPEETSGLDFVGIGIVLEIDPVLALGRPSRGQGGPPRPGRARAASGADVPSRGGLNAGNSSKGDLVFGVGSIAKLLSEPYIPAARAGHRKKQ